jgi:hypothetical protein
VVDCSASTSFRRNIAGINDLREQLEVICMNRASNA